MLKVQRLSVSLTSSDDDAVFVTVVKGRRVAGRNEIAKKCRRTPQSAAGYVGSGYIRLMSTA